jgi:peroxiredoxin
MSLRVGDPAPDFSLRDQHGRPTSLAALRGRSVVLVFYPFAFSGVCTGELRDLRDGGATRLAESGASVLAVSCDPMFALRVFADRDRLEFPLLSDFWPHGHLARAYGAFDDELGCPTRSSFVVDGDGVLRWSVHNPIGEARSVDDYVREVAALAVEKQSFPAAPPHFPDSSDAP